jgi:hypothetical protein
MRSPSKNIIRLRLSEEMRAFIRSEATLRGDISLHTAVLEILHEARQARHASAKEA